MELVATASGRNRRRFERRRSAPFRLALLAIALLSVGLRSASSAEFTNEPGVTLSATATRLIAAEDSVTETAVETASDAVEAAAEIAAAQVVADEVVSEGWNRRETLLASLTIFLLAVFLGFELINKVPPTLHTPLMSGSNAISGITLVGALLAAGASSAGWLVAALGSVAVIMATVNAVGGFAVTHRMLAMFRRK